MPQDAILDLPVDNVEEDLCMTLQVVLVGSDGLLIGSDRKVGNYLPSYRTGQRYGHPDEQSKFFCGSGGSVICAWSGEQEAQKIARRIALESDPSMPDLEWEDYLNRVAEGGREDSIGQQVIVVRKNRLDHAMRLVIAHGAAGYAARISSRICVGGPAKSGFLTEHFHKKVPVGALKGLAILTLDYGAIELPGSVGGGYDLASITETGTEWETYAPGDERVTAIRESFMRATESVIYGQGAR